MEHLLWLFPGELSGHITALSRDYITHWRDTGYLMLVARSGWQLYVNILIKTNGPLHNEYLCKKNGILFHHGELHRGEASDRVPPWRERWEPLSWDLQPVRSCSMSRGCPGLARRFRGCWRTRGSLMPVKHRSLEGTRRHLLPQIMLKQQMELREGTGLVQDCQGNRHTSGAPELLYFPQWFSDVWVSGMEGFSELFGHEALVSQWPGKLAREGDLTSNIKNSKHINVQLNPFSWTLQAALSLWNGAFLAAQNLSDSRCLAVTTTPLRGHYFPEF